MLDAWSSLLLLSEVYYLVHSLRKCTVNSIYEKPALLHLTYPVLILPRVLK